MASVRAAVLVKPKTLEAREFARPAIGLDDALLRIEACGICGSDYEQYEGAQPQHEDYTPYPVIPGHEPLGIIEEIGARAARSAGASPRAIGSRCDRATAAGTARRARAGSRAHCPKRGGTYGYTDVGKPPYLWGGYAEHMYLSPYSVVKKMDPRIPAGVAVMFNPLAAGLSWAASVPAHEGRRPGRHPRRGPARTLLRDRRARGGRPTGRDHRAQPRRGRSSRSPASWAPTPTVDVETRGRGGAGARGDRRRRGGCRRHHAVRAAARSTTPSRSRCGRAASSSRGSRVCARPTSCRSDEVIYKELTIRGVLSMPVDETFRAIEMIESGRYPFEQDAHLVVPARAGRGRHPRAGRPRARRESDPPGDRARRAASDVTSLSVPESEDQVSA